MKHRYCTFSARFPNTAAIYLVNRGGGCRSRHAPGKHISPVCEVLDSADGLEPSSTLRMLVGEYVIDQGLSRLRGPARSQTSRDLGFRVFVECILYRGLHINAWETILAHTWFCVESTKCSAMPTGKYSAMMCHIHACGGRLIDITSTGWLIMWPRE